MLLDVPQTWDEHRANVELLERSQACWTALTLGQFVLTQRGSVAERGAFSSDATSALFCSLA